MQSNTQSDENMEDYFINNWEDLEIDETLLRGIYSHGFEKPSPIQQKAIKPLLMKRDVIAQAQSGTGKTATFTIGVLHNIDLNEMKTQALILSPTKELTTQTATVIRQIGQPMTGLKVETMFGGTSFDNKSINGFKRKDESHVLCGCPGKVLDCLSRGVINASNLKIIVLDEADEMLSSGFIEQIYDIFQYLKEDVQVAFFSATLSNEYLPVINKIMNNPVKVLVKSEMLTLEGIQQYYVGLGNDAEKYETLKDLFSHISVSQCIIYCNSIRRVSDLYDAMNEDSFPVSCIHRNMHKDDRQKAFNDFKTGASRVLISTNVTSRGIDIQQVSIVINFDIPKNEHTYLHRIGRSGRWGRKGIAINFQTRQDSTKLKRFSDYYHTEIVEMPSDFTEHLKST